MTTWHALQFVVVNVVSMDSLLSKPLLVASHSTMRVCARLKLKARNESELMESEDGKGRSRKREAESSWREREGRASAEKNEELAWARC